MKRLSYMIGTLVTFAIAGVAAVPTPPSEGASCQANLVDVDYELDCQAIDWCIDHDTYCMSDGAVSTADYLHCGNCKCLP